MPMRFVLYSGSVDIAVPAHADKRLRNHVALHDLSPNHFTAPDIRVRFLVTSVECAGQARNVNHSVSRINALHHGESETSKSNAARGRFPNACRSDPDRIEARTFELILQLAV